MRRVAETDLLVNRAHLFAPAASLPLDKTDNEAHNSPLSIEEAFMPKFLGFYTPPSLPFGLAGKPPCQVYGWASDANLLVAISVMGSGTAIDAIEASIRIGQLQTFNLDAPHMRSLYGGVQSTETKFMTWKVQIPDTRMKSLVAIHESVFDAEVTYPTVYIQQFEKDEDSLDMLHRRVQHIVNISVLREWMPWIRENATYNATGERLCVALPETGMHRCAFGFRFMWVKNIRKPWEELISRGLRQGHIRFAEGSNG